MSTSPDPRAANALANLTRRHFLRDAPLALGGLWLALRDAEASPRERPVRGPHFAPRVRRVIHLHMVGAPSQLELFDYKPTLERLDGEECPASFLEGQRFAFIQGVPRLLGPRFPFRRVGASGTWISDRLPHLAELADELCFVHSVHTDQFNHGPAQLLVHCGQPRVGYPSLGAWATWGLGTENEDLPGFVVLLSGGRLPRVGKALWSSGFLPSVHQGVPCRAQGEPVLNVEDPEDVDRTSRRHALDALAALNRATYEALRDEETLTRTAQYEMAYRMQLAVPEALDLREEDERTLAMYGATPGRGTFANHCLLARRLVERGVRFVQLYDWGWDSHGSNRSESLGHGFVEKCRETDRPIAALLTDLKRRGLLEDTLVVWGGEFGRTSMRENRGGRTMAFAGRDHNPNAFTIWLAGAGVKRGHHHGATDELGYRVVEDPVSLRDVHATLLHLLGLDHARLSFPFQGLDQRLTGVEPARVVREILDP